MPSVSAISRSGITPYQNKRQTLVLSQNTDDIISAMLNSHKLDAADYDKISDKFWKGNVEATARALWDFCKKNIRYKIEPESVQTVKSLAAITKQLQGDCKHYSQFIVGVVDSLKRKGKPIDAVYRYASYRVESQDPHHVFAVVIDPATGKEYWTDPVLPTFNNRKQYQYKIDKKPMLQRVSGIGAPQDNIMNVYNLDAISGRAERKAKRQQRKAKRKERRANRPRGGLFKKIGGAPARGAYLLLMKMNVKQMAAKMFKRMKDPATKKKVLDKWRKLGGQPAKLEKAIAAGVRRYNRHHKSKKLSGVPYTLNEYGWDSSIGSIVIEDYWGEGRMGVVPVVAGAAAALATAIPVIKAMASLFKGKGGDEEFNEDMDAAEQNARQLADETSEYDYEQPNDDPDALAAVNFSDIDGNSDYDVMDPAEIEQYYGEPMGAFWHSKAKRQQLQLQRQQKKQAKRPPTNVVRKVTDATKKPVIQRIKNKTIVRPAVQVPGMVMKTITDHATGAKTLQVDRMPDDGGSIPAGAGMSPGRDKFGISDTANEFISWVKENKYTVGLSVAGLLLAPYVGQMLTGKKRRR